MNTNEVLKFVSTISNQIIEEINSSSEIFERDLKDYKNVPIKLQPLPIILDFLNKIDNKTAEDKLDKMSNKNSIFLNKLEKEKDELQQKLDDLEKCNIEAEKTVKTLEQKLMSLKAKQSKMDKKRAEILVYKLLTNTTFCYESNCVKGYVIGESPEKFKCFDLNPKKLSSKEITDALYETLNKVYNDPTEEEEKDEEKKLQN
ncbi:uncharacterized protein LOC130452928 [Diorhabda sublineata]|uniref:uncharacterized protein LOC130452928 n=1 Tax=Diorhabda sublineata TaxID=1163346 RepID=UPI0024E0DBA9|nr:uncharacterized protein LOC130452928 [Diorhabda sublineata]